MLDIKRDTDNPESNTESPRTTPKRTPIDTHRISITDTTAEIPGGQNDPALVNLIDRARLRRQAINDAT